MCTLPSPVSVFVLVWLAYHNRPLPTKKRNKETLALFFRQYKNPGSCRARACVITGPKDVGGLEGIHVHIACSSYYIEKVTRIVELQVQQGGFYIQLRVKGGKRRATKIGTTSSRWNTRRCMCGLLQFRTKEKKKSWPAILHAGPPFLFLFLKKPLRAVAARHEYDRMAITLQKPIDFCFPTQTPNCVHDSVGIAPQYIWWRKNRYFNTFYFDIRKRYESHTEGYPARVSVTSFFIYIKRIEGTHSCTLVASIKTSHIVSTCTGRRLN